MASAHQTSQGGNHAAHAGSWWRPYIDTFIALGVITVAEIAIVLVPSFPRAVVVLGLLVLSLAKAVLIAAYFMHLRWERLNLVYVVITPLILATILFFALVPDALSVLRMR